MAERVVIASLLQEIQIFHLQSHVENLPVVDYGCANRCCDCIPTETCMFQLRQKVERCVPSVENSGEKNPSRCVCGGFELH